MVAPLWHLGQDSSNMERWVQNRPQWVPVASG